jgi:hypothetical protein
MRCSPSFCAPSQTPRGIVSTQGRLPLPLPVARRPLAWPPTQRASMVAITRASRATMPAARAYGAPLMRLRPGHHRACGSPSHAESTTTLGHHGALAPCMVRAGMETDVLYRLYLPSLRPNGKPLLEDAARSGLWPKSLSQRDRAAADQLPQRLEEVSTCERYAFKESADR